VTSGRKYNGRFTDRVQGYAAKRLLIISPNSPQNRQGDRAGSDRLNWADAETSVHENPNREYGEASPPRIVSTDGRKDGDIQRYVRTPQAAFDEPETAL